MTDRNIKVGVEVDASSADQGLDKLANKAQSTSKIIKKAGEDAGQGFSKVGDGSEQASEKIDRTSKSIIQSIQRTTVALESGGRTTAKYYETIANQRGVSVDALRPYLEQLKAVETAQGKFTQSSGAAVNSLNNVGISAKQTAAAMRNVPAQFTDIVTSLQGGQAPLTVLLQQGGQLKDMFGGIGNAAGALGKYMLGLINPFTLLAGAAVAVAVGYAKGSQEASDFAKSIIMTGNAAGATANQLIQITEKLNAADAGSKRLIAESLNTLISSGKLSSGVLEDATLAAVGAQKILGIAVADTAKEYANLAKAPSEGILNLASNYKGLTVEVYKQVKALEDQGKASEAAILAQSSYAKVLTDQKDAVENTLGRWERGWNRLKDAAAGVVDSILDIGRVSSNVEQLTPLLAERRNLNSQRSKLGTSEDDNFNRGVIDSQLLGINARIKALVAEEKALILSAAAEDTANKKRLAGIEVEKMLVDSLTKTEQKKIAIAKAEAQFEIAGTKENDRKKILATIEKKYAESLTEQESAYKSLSKAISEKVGLSQIELNNEKPLTESERLRVKMLELLSNAQTKKQKQAILSLGTNIDIIKSNEITKQSYERLRKEIENYKPKITSAADIIDGIAKQNKAYSDLITTQEEYRMSLNDNADLMQIEASLMGQSATDRNTAIEQYKIEIALKKELLKIEQDINLTQAQKDERSDVARENASIAKSQAALKVQQGEWSKFYGEIYNGLSDSLYRGFEAGKGFGRSFLDSIKNLFKTNVLKIAVQAVMGGATGTLSSMAQAFGGESGGSSGGVGSYISMGKSIYEGFSSGFSGFGNSVATYVQAGLDKAGLSMTSGGNSAFASGAGTAASYAGGAAVGIYGGRAISGGYSVTGGNAAVNIGTAIGAIWGPIGMAIGGAIGGLVNRAFGRKADELQQSELSGSFGGSGFSGSVRDVYKAEGGWFSGDKWSEKGNPVADTKSLTDAFMSIKSAASGYASILGLSAESLNNFSKDFKVNLSITGDAAKDVAANEKIMTDLINGLSNDISNFLAPSLSKFAKDGEQAAATIARLSNSLLTINGIMSSVGIAEFAKSLEGASAAERLAELTGGIENLATGAQYFFENFLTDAEKIKPAADLVAETMARLGKSSVDTVPEFRELVKSLDLSSESGAKMYAELIAIAPQFKSVADYASALSGALNEAEQAAKATADALKLESDIANQRSGLQNEYNQLTMTSAELLALQRDALFESNRVLFDSIQAIKSKQSADILAAQEAQAAEQKSRDILTQKRRLDIELMSALGDAEGALAAQREDTLAALDNSLREQQRAIFAALDANAAIEKAKQSAQTAANEALAQQQQYQQEVQRQAQQAQQEYDKRFSDARSKLQSAYQSESSALEQVISKMGGFADAARKLQDSLRFGGSSPLNGSEKFDLAKSGLPSAIASARQGDPEALSKLQQFIELSKLSSKSFEDYTSDFNTVMNILDDSASTAETQEGIAKSQLSVLKTQVDSLLSVDKNVMSVGDAIRELQSLTSGGLSSVVDAITGQSNAKASAELAKAIPNTASSKYGFVGGRSYGADAVSGAYTAPWAGDAGKQYQQFYADAAEWVKTIGEATGVGEVNSFKAMTANIMMQSFDGGFGKDASIQAGKEWLRKQYLSTYGDLGGGIPSFDVGTNRVPQDMIAKIHKDEAIIPAAFNPYLGNSGGSSNQDLIEEIRMLREEVQGLRAEAQATAGHTSKTARLLDRAMPDGDALATRVAA